MAGVDFDEMRCAMALVQQQREAAMNAAASNQASVLLSQHDLAAARDQATALKAWLDVAWPAYAKSIAAEPEKGASQ